MNVFSITDDAVLCDTALCWAEVRQWPAASTLTRVGKANAEVVLCVVEGQVRLTMDDEAVDLGPMQGIQIPPSRNWAAQTGQPGPGCCGSKVIIPPGRRNGD